MEKVGLEFGGVIIAVPQFGEGARKWWDKPVPASVDGATQLGFVFLEEEMRGGGRVVIDHAHFGLSEGVENGAVQFDEGTILPKSGGA